MTSNEVHKLSSDSDEEPENKLTSNAMARPNLKRRLEDDRPDDLLKKFSKNYDEKTLKMMTKMGFEPDKGLGSRGQGRKEIVESSKQRGRRGLGLSMPQGLESAPDATWDFTEQEAQVQEAIDWLQNASEASIDLEEMKQEWLKTNPKKLSLFDEDKFVDREVLDQVLKCKSVFDNLEGEEMRQARTRSNPYESIKGGIFLNRAAMKMANMDAVLNYMFTDPQDDKGESLIKQDEPLYFSDICAGPGGFSEYVLWRSTKHFAKGFGFTLKEGANDFKLYDFRSGSQEMFEAHYGVNETDGDGDIYKSDNQEAFKKFVMNSTKNRGVHFVMADGGFSVEGQENIQEILSKRLYLCQFAVALSILRPGGNFVCKIFDIFTSFSVGLIYLMRQSFQRILIFKPVTSRPANSERYIVCNGLKSEELEADTSVEEIVPFEIITGDQEFYSYIKDSNNELGKRQIKALEKIRVFSQNVTLIDSRQVDVRLECLKAWKVPNEPRPNLSRNTLFADIQKLCLSNLPITELSLEFQKKVNVSDLQSLLKNSYNWRCVPFCGERIVYLVSGGKSNVYEYYSEKQRRDKLNIPKKTILIGSFCQEVKGQSKGQRKQEAFHVIDAIVLNGQDIHSYHYNDRVQKIVKFCSCIEMKTRPDLITIRPPKLQKCERAGEILKDVTWILMKTVKEYRPCIPQDNSDYFSALSGILFVPIMNEHWTMQFSKTHRKEYFFNTKTKESIYHGRADMFLPSHKAMTKLLELDIKKDSLNDFEGLKRNLNSNITNITPHEEKC
ncbi:DgyrCDS8465 [Dimorphilus gyrociliatus]|uniref:Cap-specific mRNA (nucleoside-2'-O-)-methyltransferase 1 n=1 Tax=Dimorphilus gyrociliatus TaxID=2664684 RepID=A0A7I8VUG2_9ANNE|nr:DgyrCDS8465 [Dimorphilus gyrociliatus]